MKRAPQPGVPRGRIAAVMRRLARAIDGLEEPAVEFFAFLKCPLRKPALGNVHGGCDCTKAAADFDQLRRDESDNQLSILRAKAEFKVAIPTIRQKALTGLLQIVKVVMQAELSRGAADDFVVDLREAIVQKIADLKELQLLRAFLLGAQIAQVIHLAA